MCSIFFNTFNPRGSQEYMPALACFIIPALIINWCEIISASAGIFLRVGLKKLENFINCALDKIGLSST